MPDQDTPAKLAALEVDVTGIKSDVTGLKTDLGALAQEFRGGIARIFDRMEAQNSKGTNWNAIAVLFTIVIALATWANTYFGQGIAAAQREATRAIEIHAQMLNSMNGLSRELTAQAIDAARHDERLKMQAAEVDRLRGRDNPARHEDSGARSQRPF